MGEGGVGERAKLQKLSLVTLYQVRVPCLYQAQFKLKAREGGETALRAVKPNSN